MAAVNLPEHLVRRLEEIARQENRPLEDVIEAMMEQYHSSPSLNRDAGVDWNSILGIFDDEVSDMSTSVKETLAE
jgi:hypothetical protein